MNLDYNDHQKVWAIAAELKTKSEAYYQCRLEFADAKFQFDMAIARNLPVLREKKPNIGIETAQIMILEGQDHAIKKLYSTLIDKENQFRGLEKIIDALKSQITLAQSLMKSQTTQGA